MTRLAEVKTASYSGKLAPPSGVRASARSSPPVSATIGGLTPQGPETTPTHPPASCPWIQRDASTVDADPCNTARPQRANPSESDRRPNSLPLWRASTRAHPLGRAELSWKLVSPYTHHTTTTPKRATTASTRCASRKTPRQSAVRYRTRAMTTTSNCQAENGSWAPSPAMRWIGKSPALVRNVATIPRAGSSATTLYPSPASAIATRPVPAPMSRTLVPDRIAPAAARRCTTSPTRTAPCRRSTDPQRPPIENVQVNHRCRHVGIGAIEQHDDDPDLSGQVFHDRSHFVAAEHDRYAGRRTRSGRLPDRADLRPEHDPVQEQQRAQGLVLRRRAHVPPYRQPRQKSGDAEIAVSQRSSIGRNGKKCCIPNAVVEPGRDYVRPTLIRASTMRQPWPAGSAITGLRSSSRISGSSSAIRDTRSRTSRSASTSAAG